MIYLGLLIFIAFIGEPILIGVAWWLRSRAADLSPWRKIMRDIALIGSSINASVFYGWIAYGVVVGRSSNVIMFKEVFGTYVGFYVALLVIAGALCASGWMRIAMFLCGVLEIVHWINFGVL